MDMRHQQLGTPDELAVLLPFDGSHGDSAAFLYTESVGLSCIHFGVGSAVAVKGALADLRVDAPWDKEGDIDVFIFQLKRFIEAEQGMLGGAIGRAQWEAKQA